MKNIRIIYPQHCEWIEIMKGYGVGKVSKMFENQTTTFKSVIKPYPSGFVLGLLFSILFRN